MPSTSWCTYSDTNDLKEVIRDLAGPLTLGSSTTVLAFFCLQFANASVLRDVGLFAGLSLIGAALCSLIFLPQLVPEQLFIRWRSDSTRKTPRQHAYQSIISPRLERWIVLVIFIVTPLFAYFAEDVRFNTDMSRLNFMNEETIAAQRQLEAINKSSLGSLYILSRGRDLENALRKTEQVIPVLNRLKDSGTINKFISPALFLISDSLQQLRIERWNRYWESKPRTETVEAVRTAGRKLKFSELVMNNFETLITRHYTQGAADQLKALRTAFFDDYIIEKNNAAAVISMVSVRPDRKEAVYRDIENTSSDAVDRQMLTNLFVEYVHADFNLIVMITAILVFVVLFISYGRIELTVITFLPMFITWIWILGIMALLKIEFNIVNVMVSTFIFGLGDDYSIFIMDGLQQEYQYEKKAMPAIRTSIFLSAITTIAGLGVLIFAKHPALRSIAAISIIGIVCVLIISQTVEPFLFRALVTNRTRKGLSPMTWVGMFRTLITYSYFVGTALLMTVVGTIIRLIPGRSSRYAFHVMISVINRLLIFIGFNIRQKIVGRTPYTFKRASVIVANHSSFLDILVTTMLYPKLILLTNKWVWNSPVMGGVVRLAEYYPVTEGAEESVEKLKSRVKEGYSVVVFPEGKRSEDGSIRRFHKGAFYLAEALKVPVVPLLIHGAADSIPKGSFYLSEGHLTLKFLPPIELGDTRYGNTYSERTKSISRYFREEFRRLSQVAETPAYFRNKLITNYLYKGPVLEWYLRIKIRLEKDYAAFHNLLPIRGNILDLGCGYGFLCHMLQFLSKERFITGVDYDEQKIATAQATYSRTERVSFYCEDVTRFQLEKYDGIVISDVLHYLTPDRQDRLIRLCMNALLPGGILIIRDGNADLKGRHRGTRLTEFFSVKILKFNKSLNELFFVSGERIRQVAEAYGLQMEVFDDAKFTSNVIFAIRKKI